MELRACLSRQNLQAKSNWLSQSSTIVPDIIRGYRVLLAVGRFVEFHCPGLLPTDSARRTKALARVPSPNGPQLCARLGATDSERFGLYHQIGHRLRTHLLHNVPSMDLYGNLGKPKFGCYLFVHEARRYQSQNLPLAGSQSLKLALQVRDDCVGLASLPIPLDRHHHSVEHLLVTKRFGQKIDCSPLHGPDGHRNVAMASHKDDWNMNVRLG